MRGAYEEVPSRRKAKEYATQTEDRREGHGDGIDFMENLNSTLKVLSGKKARS